MKSLQAYRKRNARLIELGFKSYEDYLQSPLWQQIRQEVLARDGGRCLLCGAVATNVHHTSYSRHTLSAIGGPHSALFSLCGRCHGYVEFDGDRKTNMTEMRRRMMRIAHRQGTLQTLRDRNWKHVH